MHFKSRSISKMLSLGLGNKTDNFLTFFASSFSIVKQCLFIPFQAFSLFENKEFSTSFSVKLLNLNNKWLLKIHLISDTRIELTPYGSWDFYYDYLASASNYSLTPILQALFKPVASMLKRNSTNRFETIETMCYYKLVVTTQLLGCEVGLQLSLGLLPSLAFHSILGLVLFICVS